jgi:hypothetical protein
MAAKINETCVILFVLAFALLMVFLPRHAKPQEGCQPPEVVIAAINASYSSPIEKVVTLDHDQSLRVGAWFDAQPAKSEFHFDFVIVLRHVSREIGLPLGKDGKVCEAVIVKDETVLPELFEVIQGPHAARSFILVQDTPAVHHHVGATAAVDRFYSTWFKPDNPTKSCCNQQDCYATPSKFEDGQWWAMRRDDDKYLPIPWEKIEKNRDSPDGRSHLCAPTANNRSYPPDTVFCFVLGGGT